MKMSIQLANPGMLLEQMSPAAKAKFSTEGNWAKAAGLTKETLSRLKKQASCDLSTLGALAQTAGFTLAPVPQAAQAGEHIPGQYGREYEEQLLDLSASGSVDPNTWRAHGPAFFMGGLAVMLASAGGFAREPYLRLAETLHPGVSTPEVFGLWLRNSPVRPSRFLPLARKRRLAREKV